MVPFLGPSDPFPPVESALTDPDGLLAAGGGLSVPRLIDAYSKGIFPWFNEGDPILWWSPDPRMILVPAELHVSRSLARRLKKHDCEVTCDAAFKEVIESCAGPRRDHTGTWLVPKMQRAFRALHEAGVAHSIEVWMEGDLAGGLYGVALGRMFFGESMFSKRTDASKIAIAYLAKQLEEWGFPMIDCQLETSHLRSLGARPISRREFVRELDRLVRGPAHWGRTPLIKWG